MNIKVTTVLNCLILASCKHAGKFDGLIKSYDSTNRLQYVASYIDGVREGPWITYYSNGRIKDSMTTEIIKKMDMFFILTLRGS